MSADGVVAAAGHGWGQALFPLVASAVALVFGGMLTARYLGRRRPHEGLWAVALYLYAVASFMAFLGVGAGWTSSGYRLYWLAGVALNVPFLAVGEVYLLARRRWIGFGAVLALVALSVLATVVTFTSTLRSSALSEALPRGLEAWGPAGAAYALRWLSWAGYLALVGGLVWSAFAMRGQVSLRPRVGGILAIAAGATVVAVGSGVGAGFEIVWLFAVALALGIVVMFWGFLVASRPLTGGVARPAEAAGAPAPAV